MLVRYNPEGDKALNRRQAARLKRLSDYLHGSGRLFMVELYVDAEPEQLKRFHGQKETLTIWTCAPDSWCKPFTNSRTRALSRTSGRSRRWIAEKIA